MSESAEQAEIQFEEVKSATRSGSFRLAPPKEQKNANEAPALIQIGWKRDDPSLSEFDVYMYFGDRCVLLSPVPSVELPFECV